MDFRNLLTKEHSKRVRDIIIAEVIKEPARLEELIHLFQENDIRLTQRVAWPLGELGKYLPNAFNPYFNLFIRLLEDENQSDTIVRNVLRTLQFVSIPEQHQGAILDNCFKLMMNPKSAVAIKAFSMTIVFNLSKSFPEIQNELKACVEELMIHGRPAVMARGRNILKNLKRI